MRYEQYIPCDTVKQITEWKLKMKLNQTKIGQKESKTQTPYRILAQRMNE